MEKQYLNLQGEERKITTGDMLATLYPTFNKYKFAFNKNYDTVNMKWNDFNKFYDEIQYINKTIEKYININFNIEWDITDTDDFILLCFYKYHGKKVSNDGYIIELLKKNEFEKGFCATLKQILRSLILKKINNNKKNNYYNYIGDDNMETISDLNNCFENIETLDKFDSFIKTLNNKESRIFNLSLFSVSKLNKVDINEICRICNISTKTYRRQIKKIYDKYNQFIEKEID